MSTKGMLRRMDDKLLILEAEDHRIVRFQLSENTKYLKSLKDLSRSEIKPGDHLMVESAQDDQGYQFALTVNFEKAGTDADRTAANIPDEILKPPGTGPSGTPSGSSDDERPRQKRAGSKPADKADKEEESAKPSAKESDANVPPPETPEDNRPRTVVVASEPLRGVDGEAPPKIKRGKPAGHKSSSDDEPQEIASVNTPGTPSAPGARPTTGAIRPDVEQPQARQVEEPEAAQEDPLITRAREAAEAYTETLPNYVVTQNTTRYISTTTKPSWQAQDIYQRR